MGAPFRQKRWGVTQAFVAKPSIGVCGNAERVIEDDEDYSYDTSFSRKPGGYIGSVRGPYSFDITERMSYGNDDY